MDGSVWRSRSLAVWLVAVELVFGNAIRIWAQPGPSPEELARIRSALPAKASVLPRQARRILVFNRAWGYRHTAIPYGAQAFALMGEKTGAYQCVVTEDLSWFEPENLNRFDAVLFNNTNNEIFLPETLDGLSAEARAEALRTDARLKKALEEFLAGGKGLVVIHAGVASFREWPEFGVIMGARFDNHPWNAGSTVTLKVEDPSHPVCAALGEGPWQITDEIYQFKEPYSRRHLRVLISVDTTRTDLGKVQGIHRTDGDFALGWVKSYGKGRVFYCALGHQHDIFWNPVVLRHYLDGVQFALGDLDAPVAAKGE